jgi:hypothetical protein
MLFSNKIKQIGKDKTLIYIEVSKEKKNSIFNGDR